MRACVCVCVFSNSYANVPQSYAIRSVTFFFIHKTRSEKCELHTNFEISGVGKGEPAETVSPATLPNITLEWVANLRHDFCLGSRFLGAIRWLNRSQWTRGLRRRLVATRLLWFWVRITPGAWMSVCCGCCVLSGRCFWDGLITRPEESYRVWCVWLR